MDGWSGSLQPISETRQMRSFKQPSKSRTLTKHQQAVHGSAVGDEGHQQSHQQSGVQSTSKPLKFLAKLKDCFVEQLLTPEDDKSSAMGGGCFQTVGMLNLRGCEALGKSFANATGSAGANSNRRLRRVHTTML